MSKAIRSAMGLFAREKEKIEKEREKIENEKHKSIEDSKEYLEPYVAEDATGFEENHKPQTVIENLSFKSNANSEENIEEGLPDTPVVEKSMPLNVNVEGHPELPVVR